MCTISWCYQQHNRLLFVADGAREDIDIRVDLIERHIGHDNKQASDQWRFKRVKRDHLNRSGSDQIIGVYIEKGARFLGNFTKHRSPC